MDGQDARVMYARVAAARGECVLIDAPDTVIERLALGGNAHARGYGSPSTVQNKTHSLFPGKGMVSLRDLRSPDERINFHIADCKFSILYLPDPAYAGESVNVWYGQYIHEGFIDSSI